MMGRKFRFISYLGTALMATSFSARLLADNSLSAVSNGTETIEIQLNNDQPIAGLQFIIHSSSNVALREIHKSERTSSTNWMIASNLINDTTLSVVIVSSDLSYFSSGKGSVAEVTFLSDNNQSGAQAISFTGVVAADPQAQLVDLSANGLILNGQDQSASIQSSDFSLGQNYPNPFNPSTRITYELKRDAHVSLTVFDITGRQVSVLAEQYQSKGTYTVTWNSSENRFGQLASGTYFARLQVGDHVVTKKMLLTK